MTEESKLILGSIGFVRELSTNQQATWEEMYQRLVAYKKEHTSICTKVSQRYKKEERELGDWVNN